MCDLRIGYDIINDEIPDGSRVLDLGCGDGTLLSDLEKLKNIDGSGIEISSEGVSICLEKGLYCCQGDIDHGLSDYRDNSFDYVILNQTLQDTKKPEFVIKEIMRICYNAIISFPNFGYIKNRLQLTFSGIMPKNRLLPYDWFVSPNIHPLSIKDFHAFCKSRNYPIKKRAHFSCTSHGKSCRVQFIPNLFAEYGFFILDGKDFGSS